MTTPRIPNRNSVLILLGAILVFAIGPATRAQIPAEQAKMAGAIPLTTQLLDKLDKFAQAISGDAEAKSQYAASGKDSSMSPDSAQSVIDSKYPKLAAAFKTSGLTVDEFIKTMMALPITAAIAEMGGTPEDSTAVANLAFYKANKDRVTATMTKLEGLEK
jgi:hypothetical protein